ncbi:TVP38/TMEM64 family protein [Thermodesulfobacteriota bacterium]
MSHSDNNNKEKTRLIIAFALLALIGAALLALFLSGRLGPAIQAAWEIFRTKEQLREYVQSWGSSAPLAFMAIQIFQVVLAPIPGEFTGAVGGFIFGAWPTVLYSTIGLSAGSALAFTAARIIGQPIVKLVVSKKNFEKFEFLTKKGGSALALVLFLIPGFPKDILSYLLGLSPMGFVTFITVCTIGRIPGTVLLSFSGSAVYEENWGLLAIMSVVCAVILLVLYLYRGRLDAWIRRGEESP